MSNFKNIYFVGILLYWKTTNKKLTTYALATKP